MTGPSAIARILHIEPVHSCETCTVRRMCLPLSLEGTDLDQLGELVHFRPPMHPGEYLYRAGDGFRYLYAIKSGSLKTSGLTTDGREQVTGFHLSGELVGLDAIGTGGHNCDAVALEPTVVCQLPYDRLQSLARDIPQLQHELACIMSREIQSEARALLMIGRMTAEQRVACFLENLHQRFDRRGADGNVIELPMSREDIGNYLGLTLETVSRRLSDLQHRAIIRIDKRRITVLDLPGLASLCVS